jgi:hypothetical protein
MGVACETPRGTATSLRRCNSFERGPGTAVSRRIAAISIPSNGLFVEVNVYLLGLEVFLNSPKAKFAAEA